MFAEKEHLESQIVANFLPRFHFVVSKTSVRSCAPITVVCFSLVVCLFVFTIRVSNSFAFPFIFLLSHSFGVLVFFCVFLFFFLFFFVVSFPRNFFCSSSKFILQFLLSLYSPFQKKDILVVE